SGLKDRERLFHWQALRKGTVRIAVGVRSAVFAPVENLGLVVVDEEHATKPWNSSSGRRREITW
ncbi:MAG TPA: hypothetical protein VFZ09_39335, partial [Archangium sp.]|uniref:hypothetical protein n=1 Tax=Archangium sp. TaxID=1872627 RepID=UPI002E322ADB